MECVTVAIVVVVGIVSVDVVGSSSGGIILTKRSREQRVPLREGANSFNGEGPFLRR